MIHIIDDYYVTGGARDYTLLKDCLLYTSRCV